MSMRAILLTPILTILIAAPASFAYAQLFGSSYGGSLVAQEAINEATKESLIVCAEPPNCKFEELIQTINNLIEFVVIIAASVVALMFAYAGWLYMTAFGDSGKLGQARKIFSTTAIGFVIVLAAWLIVKFVVSGLGLTSEYDGVLTQ